MMRGSLTLFALLTVFALSGAAQERPVTLETAPPGAAPKSSVIKTIGAAQLSYADVPDESTGRSASIQLHVFDGWGQFSASFRYKGRVFRKPDAIDLHVFLATKDRTFVDNRQIVLTVDGKKAFDGIADLRDGRTNGREIYSSLGIKLPLDEFKKLAGADEVIIKVGPTSWSIPSSSLSTFKDLISLIETGQAAQVRYSLGEIST